MAKLGRIAKTKQEVAHTGRLLVYANGLAALCMFISWLGQNIYQSDMSSKAEKMQRDVQFINSEMSKALIWMQMFQSERRKEKPDKEVILNSATGYADTTATIVQAASRVNPDSDLLKKHVDEDAKLIKAVREATEKRDLNQLMKTASDVMMWFGQIGPEAHEEMNRRAKEVSEKESMAKWVFRGFFLAGSFVLAFTWWKTNKPNLLK